MSNRFNGKIHSSIKKYMNDCTNESMRQKIEYYNGLRFENLLKNTPLLPNKESKESKESKENKEVISVIEILTESLNLEQNANKNKTIIPTNYFHSFIYSFYSKMQTNFFVFLLLIYNNGIRNK